MAEKTLTMEEREELARRHFGFLDRYKNLTLAGLDDIPDLLFRPIEGAYTDKGTIVIGLSQPFMAGAADEPEFVNASLYLLGHEMQHDLCTADKAWKWGLSQGRKLIYESLAAALEGKGRRFVKVSDYGSFADAMKKKDIFISDKQIMEIVHFIQNSLEDGRIERIRSNTSLTFKDMRDYFRGKFWLMKEADPDDLLTKSGRFRVIMNQILALATTGLYQKGYGKVADEVDETVETLIPYIARGIYSPSCKQCMEEAVKIERKLLPDIIDMIKDQKADPGSKGAPAPYERGVTSKSEVTDDSEEGREAYERLGKEEEEEEKKEKESASGKKTGPSERKSSPESAKEKGEGKASKDGKEDGPDSGASEEGNDGDPKDGKRKDGKEPEKGEFRFAPGQLCGHRILGRDERIASDPKEVCRQIKERMKEAAEGTLQKEADNAMAVMPSHPDPSENIPDEEALKQASRALTDKYEKEDIKVSFFEHKREYDLGDVLPTDLQGKAAAFKKEVEKLFIREKTPCVKGMRSGIVDPSSIWKLTVRQFDIYEKRQKDKIRTKAVYVLVDNSGSMGWGSRHSKRWHACRALSIIEEGFKAHVPMKITAFDAQGAGCVTHEVIKGWAERHPENCSYNFLTRGRRGYGNKDGYSIRIAKEELQARPEDDKLLIVLSDGAPTDYVKVSPEADVREAVKETRNAGIEVVGIFFADDWESNAEAEGFKAMYGNIDSITCAPEDIAKNLVRVLQRFVFSKR